MLRGEVSNNTEMLLKSKMSSRATNQEGVQDQQRQKGNVAIVCRDIAPKLEDTHPWSSTCDLFFSMYCFLPILLSFIS